MNKFVIRLLKYVLINDNHAISDNYMYIICIYIYIYIQCIVGINENDAIVLNTKTNEEIKANDNCVAAFICSGSTTSIVNAEDAPAYSDDMGWDNNQNYDYDYYGFNPELVCMQYQYYVAISTLIMVCFATFICMTVIILNKIKDHQTMVHVRI